MSTLTNDLARLANSANVLATAITVNSSAITSVNVGGIAINSSGFSGVANQATYANGSFTNTFTVGTAAYFVANGNIGFGQNNPIYPLDVYKNDLGVIRVGGGSGTNQGGAFYIKYANVSSNETLAAFGDGARIVGGTPDQIVTLYTGIVPLNFHVSGSERLRISTNGNIGLAACTTPIARFDVGSVTVANTPMMVLARPSGGDVNFNLAASSGSGTAVNTEFCRLGLLYSNNIHNAGIGFYRGNDTTGGYMTFNVNNWAEAVRIAANGNVGIGTSNNTAKFAVQELGLSVFKTSVNLVTEYTVNTSATSLFDHDFYGGVAGGSGFYRIRKAGGTFASPTLVSSGSVLGRWGAMGYDGTQFLDAGLIRVATDGTPASNNMPGAIEFWTTETSTLSQKMKISANGNVGIGITNPQTKLHIIKDFAASSPEFTGAQPMKKRWVATVSQGPNGHTYKICTISRDPINWGEQSPIEIIARNTYYAGGSYSRWVFTHGYGIAPSLVCVETGGISGNIPNLYLGSEVTVNSNLRYTPIFCDSPYYRQFNFEISHNYQEVSSITAANQILFDNTYTANSSATMYSGNMTLAPNGGGVIVNGTSFLSGMSGTFAVGSGRQISIDGGNGGEIRFKGDTGGWAMGSYAIGSSGTNRGGFGWLGGVDSVSYYWVATAYNGTGVQLSYGGNSWSTLSDLRDKNVYNNIENALDKISSINSVYYNYKTDEEDTPRRVGFIAQEVQAVYPEAVTEIQREIDNPTEETKRLSLSYTDMIPLLLQAIKELKEEFDEYKRTHP
jgi:hypothetical protein